MTVFDDIGFVRTWLAVLTISALLVSCSNATNVEDARNEIENLLIISNIETADEWVSLHNCGPVDETLPGYSVEIRDRLEITEAQAEKLKATAQEKESELDHNPDGYQVSGDGWYINVAYGDESAFVFAKIENVDELSSDIEPKEDWGCG